VDVLEEVFNACIVCGQKLLSFSYFFPTFQKN